MINLYIYYRVAEADRDEADQLIRSVQARLACRTGIRGNLLRKLNEPGLWMEVYEAIDDIERFNRELGRLEDEYDIAPFIDGTRHREYFEMKSASIPSCR